MALKTIKITEELYKYILDVSLKVNPVLNQLKTETLKLKENDMQIAQDQGQFFSLLLKLMGAKKIIEVGVFTGYSTLIEALAIPEDGEIIACDISEEWTNIGRKYWKKAGVEHKIDLKLGPAVDTLKNLIDSGRSSSFDFAFIDANKKDYLEYFELCLSLIRTGGLIAIDNVLWNGIVIDETVDDVDTNAIREFNKALYKDNRIEISLVPIGDGVTLALKK